GFDLNFSILPDCRSRIPCYTAASRLPALVRRSELQENDMPDQNTPASGFQFGLANLKPAEPLEKITLTFPDGAKREYARDITGLDLAKGISPSLATLRGLRSREGVVTDSNDPISGDAKSELITRDDARALELIRHDCAHVL